MKQHANIGADILGSIHFPYPVVPIVRHHHESWNGTGYPDKLKGVAIPLGARILSVVDCFDALTSDRPYRPALSTEDAIAILVQRRGTMYDPLIVDRFIEAQQELSEIALDQRGGKRRNGEHCSQASRCARTCGQHARRRQRKDASEGPVALAINKTFAEWNFH